VLGGGEWQSDLWNSEGETVDSAKRRESFGESMHDNRIARQQRLERTALVPEDQLPFALHVSVFAWNARVRRSRRKLVEVGSDGAAVSTSQQQARHGSLGATSGARLDAEEHDEVEETLAGHYDEDRADARQPQTDVVAVAKHTNRTAVSCTHARTHARKPTHHVVI